MIADDRRPYCDLRSAICDPRSVIWKPAFRELKERRRRRQRQRRKTIGLMSKNNRSARAFYILEKQQREITTFKVLWRT